MSDVIWAAGIAGLVGVAGNVAQYLGVRTAAGVESSKVEAENQRLRQQVRDAERSNRQGTYHRMLAVLTRMDLYATGGHPDDESEYKKTLDEYNTLAGGVLLFGPEPV